MPVIHFFRRPALSEDEANSLYDSLMAGIYGLRGVETEFCFNVEVSGALAEEEEEILGWLLRETFEPECFSKESFLKGEGIVEVGPRMSFQTAWSANAVSVCGAIGLHKIKRIERSRRYCLKGGISEEDIRRFTDMVYDRMTECPYPDRLKSFETGIMPEPVRIVPVIEKGKDALYELNGRLGLGLDDWDVEYYYGLFAKDMGRNPTDVECFDLAQSNSEHSRHWFFKGRLMIDGKEAPESLLDIIRAPYGANPRNSVIAFKDNSSAIAGFEINTIVPARPGRPSKFVRKKFGYNPIFTAETHNFPSGVAPFPGAETGTGGRIRDVEAVGRGGLVVAGTAAYCVGNLRIPGYEQPWEDGSFKYPRNLASPLKIEIEASNGASDYGNKFGEPLIQGYTRSFGLRLPDGQRREWIKPIMFTGGVGQMDERHTEKMRPEKGMLVLKVGGPAYRIGMGGGAASSMIQGENVEELDFNAVQRGDAEMEQKLNRVIRASVEMGDRNPIVSIHDQGAGGNCNVLKEIVAPEGARIDVRKIPLGDETLSVLEIWGAEYQEQNALLIKAEDAAFFEALCRREKVPCAFVGEITGDGKMTLFDGLEGGAPVDLDLKKVLGEMPRKTFELKGIEESLKPLEIPRGTTVRDALQRVLRLLSVGSKRFLTTKADRSVTGLVARQQCSGPLGLTVSDVSVIAQSHYTKTGVGISIGEQPLVGLISPAAMARMSVSEALTNMVWAKISSIEDIKCSANWMWAAKLPGEGARLYDAAVALRDVMLALGIAVDGGKDSLSMAALVGETGETVKAPGALVISAYAPCPDVSNVVTPDIKRPGGSRILYIDMGKERYRTGGSALAQVYGQIGEECPDMEDPGLLKNTFNALQRLIARGMILSGHDRSDGGIATTLLEMAFSGDSGVEVDIKSPMGAIETMFSEEAGIVVEYDPDKEKTILRTLKRFGVPACVIGRTTSEKKILVSVNGTTVLDESMPALRALWEETSRRLDMLQANPRCVAEETNNTYERKAPDYRLSFTPKKTGKTGSRPKVAILREEGSNGDREMASAFHQAGFEPWDVTVTDLMDGSARLKMFRGVAFVGGFSYADVLDSAKGWAGVIRFNERLRAEFRGFYERPDTFSLGVCNGCQLMALLGLAPWQDIEDERKPRFIRNASGRFESRFSTVRILGGPSLMLKGMEGSVLGVWVAHGEGRVHFPDKGVYERVISGGLAPIRFADDSGEPTERYPFNPNGSKDGITALCTPDGRHLAMMPHPERTFLKWQWAWMPEEWKKTLEVSPWLRMFQNARKWCDRGGL